MACLPKRRSHVATGALPIRRQLQLFLLGGFMKRLLLSLGIVFLLVEPRAKAEFRQIDLTIFGMD